MYGIHWMYFFPWFEIEDGAGVKGWDDNFWSNAIDCFLFAEKYEKCTHICGLWMKGR